MNLNIFVLQDLIHCYWLFIFQTFSKTVNVKCGTLTWQTSGRPTLKQLGVSMPVALQSSEQFEGCIWASQQQPEPLRADMQDNAVCLFVCLSVSWSSRTACTASQLSLSRISFWVKCLPFCQAQERTSWTRRRGPRKASRNITRWDSARPEPTGSPEPLWSCFVLSLLFNKQGTIFILRNVYHDAKLKPDPLQTHVGNATPTRILPKG